ncbi:MAG: hypothetical protein ACJASF_002258 [Vicingaceae bacterium]|jgi:hypothetical protein
MKIVQLKSNSYSSPNNSPLLKEVGTGDNAFSIELDDAEMRLAFFSKGSIHLESGDVVFEIKNNQGLSLAQTDCFGQLISNNFDRLFSTCRCFKYNGSAVRFTVSFYNENNQFLGKLISDSIFKNIGFGRGEGEWMKREEK